MHHLINSYLVADHQAQLRQTAERQRLIRAARRQHRSGVDVATTPRASSLGRLARFRLHVHPAVRIA